MNNHKEKALKKAHSKLWVHRWVLQTSELHRSLTKMIPSWESINLPADFLLRLINFFRHQPTRLLLEHIWGWEEGSCGDRNMPY